MISRHSSLTHAPQAGAVLELAFNFPG